ncbi:DUF4395 domain-containing protein [Gorillibacterium massiliense]|uniref:DUF4395 domain-containing protein n=1 Tax=Gorillibacterium massiliense TaxID=1280390 RepID=UPI0004BBEF89|nr:DUF4395 domain-containing protein [Gorillibacterium massiliense]
MPAKEIPVPYVKANQTGIVLTVAAAFLFQEPWAIAALWAIQVIGLLTHGKGNLFVLIGKSFLQTTSSRTEAYELQRFNNTLAVLFLTLSLLSFGLGWTVAGYVFAVMLFAAAGAALAGYCIGCTVYFQYKQWKARRRLRSSAS